MNGNQPMMLPQPKSKTWLWVVLIVIALLAILVAFYFYYYSYAPMPTGTAQETGTADEVAAIEQDLKTVDLEGLDAELGDIDKELAQ